MRNGLVFAMALAAGLLFAYVDSRPTWDDAGVMAMAILLASGILAAIAPSRPWLLALAVGIWIPLHGVIFSHAYGSILALLFAFAGAYIGAGVHRAAAGPLRPGATD